MTKGEANSFKRELKRARGSWSNTKDALWATGRETR
jgi:hypothetical protein